MEKAFQWKHPLHLRYHLLAGPRDPAVPPLSLDGTECVERRFRKDKERGVADTLQEGSLMLKYYEHSELLEGLQSSDCYGTFNWAHTLGVAQNQKQPYIPST